MIDVSYNRQATKWTHKELVGRVLWGSVGPLFRFSPRIFWSWRNFMLRLFGAQIGKEVHVFPTVRVSIPWNISIGDQTAVGDRAILYALGPIKLGARVTISQGAHLCAGTHEYRLPDMPLQKLPIEIGDDAWICADAFVGPRVKVGDLAIVGARAVVVKDVPPRMIVAGNPARNIGER